MADAERVETMVRELVATGTMWPETVADLERFVAEAKAGTLAPDDFNYIVAFHAKNVLEADAPVVEPAGPAVDWKGRFDEIRARFARLYDPAAHPDDAGETLTRAQVFEEFWSEFDSVENG